jgi:L-ascorbate metabolism protein UlaG (beta-lactamase superfamily)
MTPMHHAVKKGDPDVVRYLADHGAFLNVKETHQGLTELHLAAAMGYGDIADLLMEKGSCYGITDDKGKTPLDYALDHGQERIAFDMIGKGADEGKLAGWMEAECPLSKQQTRGDAAVWFLGHSGWAIKTQNHFLVFDYFDDARSRKPDHACLNSGCIDTAELKHQHVTVFSTHEHLDHYNASIFGWKNGIPETEYVLCFHPAGETGDYTYIPEHTRATVDGMDIYVIHSTDLGGGYLVEVDGLVIFFMGDHANGEDKLMEEYTSEIDDIAGMGKEIDLMFGPIRGCSLGTPEQVKAGIYYALDKLRPALFVPMHSGHFSFEYKAFVEQAAADGVPQTMTYTVSKGDRFVYKKDSGIEGLSQKAE